VPCKRPFLWGLKRDLSACCRLGLDCLCATTRAAADGEVGHGITLAGARSPTIKSTLESTFPESRVLNRPIGRGTLSGLEAVRSCHKNRPVSLSLGFLGL